MVHQELELLTPIELVLLQKHVKLGKEYLRHRLSEDEIAQVFHLGQVDKQTRENVDLDFPEFMGKTSALINTAFTTILGAWLGISGFLEFGLGSTGLFILLIAFCALVGAAEGFINYNMIKGFAHQMLEAIRMKLIEINILKVLNHHKRDEIRHKTHELSNILTTLKIKGIELLDQPLQEINDHEITLNWLNQTNHVIEELENKGISQAFTSNIQETKDDLQERLLKDQKRKKKKMYSIVTKLSTFEKPNPPKKSWLKANYRSILISLIPVLIGSFSSLFVYFAGGPKFAEDMGQHELYLFLTRTEVKIAEVAIGVLITLYFIYSFLYNNWKEYKRQEALKKMELSLIQEEAESELLDNKLLLINQVEHTIKPISHLYHTLKKIAVN